MKRRRQCKHEGLVTAVGVYCHDVITFLGLIISSQDADA